MDLKIKVEVLLCIGVESWISSCSGIRRVAEAHSRRSRRPWGGGAGGKEPLRDPLLKAEDVNIIELTTRWGFK